MNHRSLNYSPLDSTGPDPGAQNGTKNGEERERYPDLLLDQSLCQMSEGCSFLLSVLNKCQQLLLPPNERRDERKT